MNEHYVSVIVPTYHDWQRLQLCLEALSNQTIDKSCFEIIIVNNDPGDAPENFNFPSNAILVEEGKPGSYAARNHAIKISRGDILAFTDSDCIPYKDWLEKGISALESSPAIERTGGKIELFFKNPTRLTLAETYEKAFAFPQQKYISEGTAATANMMTYRRNFDTVGPFNENLYSGGDTEWGLRASLCGLPIAYAPDCVVKHPARHRIHELLSKARRVSGGHTESLKLQQKNFSWRNTFLFRQYDRVMNVLRMKHLTFKEKLLSLLIVYFIMTYKLLYFGALKIGIVRPHRS